MRAHDRLRLILTPADYHARSFIGSEGFDSIARRYKDTRS